jgi:DNA-binding transcriptional regulator YiaG
MSFMMQIEAAQRAPLDQLAVDYCRAQWSGSPSIDFCRRVFGVPERDEVVARRLGVAVSTVRGWREVGRRARSGWSCR